MKKLLAVLFIGLTTSTGYQAYSYTGACSANAGVIDDEGNITVTDTVDSDDLEFKATGASKSGLFQAETQIDLGSSAQGYKVFVSVVVAEKQIGKVVSVIARAQRSEKNQVRLFGSPSQSSPQTLKLAEGSDTTPPMPPFANPNLLAYNFSLMQEFVSKNANASLDHFSLLNKMSEAFRKNPGQYAGIVSVINTDCLVYDK